MAKRPELVGIKGALAGRRITVGSGPVRLGRSSSNDIHVPDEELSRNHCVFDPSGETGIRLTDLASANGTFVNGREVGADPVELQLGDVIELGACALRVGDEPEPKKTALSGSVDLGLGAKDAPSASPNPLPAKRRSPLANILWIVAVLMVIGTTALILLAPPKTVPEPSRTVAKEEAQPVVREVFYEKVKADSKGIFRFALTYEADGVLSVKVDDTSNNRRMPAKRKELPPESRDELNDILSWTKLSAFDSAYVGLEPDPPAADTQVLRVIYSTCVKEIRIANTDEPESFSSIREKLESFSKSELGVWAIAYSRKRLIELAEDSVRLGDTKWDERDVNYGNLSAAITAYQEASFYLETVNPKPSCIHRAKEGLERATKELDERYKNQRFQADRALNLGQWETARDELHVLLEMVPDKRDPRNRDARQKLISAETNINKRGK